MRKSEKMFNRGWGRIAGEYGDLFLDGNKLVDEIGVDYQVDNADDVGHLNYLGNQKYTKYLGTYIKEHYTVSDRRADAAYESWQKNADYIREMIVNQELKESGIWKRYAKSSRTLIIGCLSRWMIPVMEKIRNCRGFLARQVLGCTTKRLSGGSMADISRGKS